MLQMQQFQVERLAGSLLAVGGMEEVIKLTIKYCRERQTFGQPLIDNQWIHFKLAELISEVEILKQFKLLQQRPNVPLLFIVIQLP